MEDTIPELSPPPLLSRDYYTSRIKVWDNVIDEKTCQWLCDYAATHPYRPIGEAYRKTFMFEHDEICNEMDAIFYRLFTTYVEPYYNVRIEWWEKPQFLYYGEGCKYDVHSDGGGWTDPANSDKYKRTFNRDISQVLYINDNFTGGGLRFPNYDVEVQPKPGRLVAFPSTSEYQHAALETKSGKRYAIVAWAAIEGSSRLAEKKSGTRIFMKDFRKT